MFRQATRILTGLLASVMVALYADVAVAGTWEGKENGLPAVELTLRNDSGQIGGTIGFYFQTRGNDGKWHPDGKPPFVVPLLSPKHDGTVLTFETIHHRSHGTEELGPNNKIGDSGEAERLFRREVERHSGMIPNTIGA